MNLFTRCGRTAAVAGVAVLALVACGDDEAAKPAGCTSVDDGRATLVARNLTFDEDCFSVAAGTTVTFRIELRDGQVKHNLAISGLPGKAETPLEAGPKTQILEVEFPDPGRHPFVCDLHANMKGAIYVE